jgi:hypothetical protein
MLSAAGRGEARCHCRWEPSNGPGELRSEGRFDSSTKGRWIDRRKPIELGLHACEILKRALLVDQPTRNHRAYVAEVLLVAPLDFRECLAIQVEMEEGYLAKLTDKCRSSQPGGIGMKSAGEASSTLIWSSSFNAGIARKSASSSGRITRSTSMVVPRHPIKTAVVPPTKWTRTSARAARPNASISRWMRSRSASARTRQPARSLPDGAPTRYSGNGPLRDRR